MLASFKEIMEYAEKNNCAVGSFNTPAYGCIKAVLNAAEYLNEPVIIMHAQVHEEMGIIKMDEIIPYMLFAADRAKVPVCVHLDHGTDESYINKGLKLGLKSVMYDGSALDYRKNLDNTKRIVETAKKYGASVEAETGVIGARDSHASEFSDDKSIYTDPAAAAQFAENTGIDALACAFGTAHGLYFKEPVLDFERLRKIHESVKIPLVMHGASGISEENFRKAIKYGIRKINYYTYMAKAGGEAIKECGKTYYHDFEKTGIYAMEENVKSAIKIFSGKNT